MPNTPSTYEATLPARRRWIHHLTRIGADHGFFERLDERHLALFVEEGDHLVISFDRAERIWDNGEEGMPLGFDLVPSEDMSLLSIIALGRTWFDTPELDSFFDGLLENGTFDGFSQIMILATGPDCGQAAARLARALPRARVLLSRPASPSYRAPGETPGLGDQGQMAVLFDSANALEKAQAEQLSHPNMLKIAMPHSGTALDRALAHRDVLVPMARSLARDGIDLNAAIGALLPVLRRDPAYLSRLAEAPAP